jgi:ABC-type multidrug transport system ATPase subunit
MSDVLIVSDVSKRYGKTTVLRHLDMAVPEGSIFGLIGPNGAGKTTTIKILMNLVSATSGKAQVLGHDSRKLSGRDFQDIGYVTEDQRFPEWMTVEYLMKYLRPFYPAWEIEREQQLLRDFELPKDRKLKHLSRGMRMKVYLACSLAYRPRLIVMDEPFSGLDPLVRDELSAGMLENADGATLLVSSHDLAEIESFTSHIAYLDRGRLQFTEEMSSLTTRFREVEVTTDLASQTDVAFQISDKHWPTNWLNPERSSALVRFVETDFEHERTLAEVRRVFGEPRHVEMKAMPLRSIFVTLAKAGREVE